MAGRIQPRTDHADMMLRLSLPEQADFQAANPSSLRIEHIRRVAPQMDRDDRDGQRKRGGREGRPEHSSEPRL